MVELSHDWIDATFKLCVIAASGLGTLVGGIGGGRAIIRWFVRKLENIEAQKQRDRDAIASKAATEITRKNREHDDSLSDLRNQNEKLWDQNKELWDTVKELQDRMHGVKEEVKAVQHDMGEVQMVVGANQEKIHQVETNTKIMATAADAIKSMNQFNKNEPSTE